MIALLGWHDPNALLLYLAVQLVGAAGALVYLKLTGRRKG